MRYPARAFWCVVLFWAIVLALFLGVKDVSADHRACNPGTLSFPRTWSIQPGVDPAPWQIAQGLINRHDTRRDWVKWVPWGQPSNVYVIAGTDQMWVRMDCPTKISIVYAYGTPAHVSQWAAHESMHAFFYVGDHIYSYQYPAAGYMNPEYCNAPREQLNPEYRGGMSYCEGPAKLFYNFPAPYFDDFDMMRALFP